MDFIKHQLIHRYRIYFIAGLTMLLSITLLLIRIKLTHSNFYLFLVWNLFLAVIPFAITRYLCELKRHSKLILVFWFGVWLLFLPNAPYLITDLKHLKLSSYNRIWLDILVVTSFALNGLLFFYLSITDMKIILKSYFKSRIINVAIPLIIFTCAFGIYLGRVLRYNSWELLTNPKYLFIDIINIALKPLVNKETWLFIILFGCFLNVGFWVFKQFYKKL